MARIDVWWGDARKLLPGRLGGQRIEFLFLDGLPRQYLEYLQVLQGACLGCWVQGFGMSSFSLFRVLQRYCTSSKCCRSMELLQHSRAFVPLARIVSSLTYYPLHLLR